MIKSWLRSVLKRVGIEVRRVYAEGKSTSDAKALLGYDMEEEASRAIQIVQGHTMLPYPRQIVLYQQAAFCEVHKIPGCFVECGTWRGGASGLMALANLARSEQRRHLHLFDSFEGLPEPRADKDGIEAIEWAQKHGAGTEGRLVAIKGTYTSVGSLDVNRQLLEQKVGYPNEFLHYHKGWFENTVPCDAPALGAIAILRLDGDWYESTRVCLANMYDLVVPGGFIIMDDYNAVEGCRRATDEFITERRLKVFLSHLDGHGRYWIKE